MNGPSSWPTLVAVVRFYLRPVRRQLDRAAHGSTARRTWGVRLGPVEVGGHQVVLRSPRINDAAAWREVRLRERERIEPWWATSTLSWEDRHTEARWVSSFLDVRQVARAGRALPLVVEFDGRFGGQCNLEWVAPHIGTAEMGIWLDSRYAGKGVSAVAAALMVDHAMTALGLHRLSAPIAEGNTAAAWGAKRLGLAREGTMAGFLHVGGERRDHHLWAITSEQIPAGGLTAAMVAAASRPRAPRTDAVNRLS